MCIRDRRVVAYYALANGALAVADAPGAVRRNMPDPIPVSYTHLDVYKRQGKGRAPVSNSARRVTTQRHSRLGWCGRCCSTALGS